MRHFYVIANYAKPHTLFCVQEIKEYLTAKGAECVIAGPAASDNAGITIQILAGFPATHNALLF